MYSQASQGCSGPYSKAVLLTHSMAVGVKACVCRVGTAACFVVTSCHLLFSDGGSGQRWDRRAGEPGWNPEAALPLPQGRAPATVPLLSGEWAASARAAGPTALVTERKGMGLAVGRLEEAGGCQPWGITGPYCNGRGVLQRSSLRPSVMPAMGIGGFLKSTMGCAPAGEGVS